MQENNSIYGGYTPSYFYFLIIFLGAISAFGPLLTDMYLPTLPAMVDDFHTTPAMVQLSLTMGMIGLAVGQVFFGPLSQKYGRRPVLIISMAMFVVAAVTCVFSKSIIFFLVCRLAQGLGGSGGIVLSRSIATDCYSGRNLRKMMAIIGAINGIAPATAPVIGGLMAKAVGWQGIFMVLAAIGVVLVVMSMVFRETLSEQARIRGSIFSTFKDYGSLLRYRRFMALVVCYGLSSGALFAYISAAPFILQSHYGFSELLFALTFGINSVVIGLGSGLALKFSVPEKAMLVGALGMGVGALLQIAGVATLDTFVAYEVTTLVLLLSLGMVFTISTSMAMDCGRQYTGAAAAIVGAVGFVFGGIISPLVSIGNTQYTSALILLLCSLGSVALTRLVYRHR